MVRSLFPVPGRTSGSGGWRSPRPRADVPRPACQQRRQRGAKVFTTKGCPMSGIDQYKPKPYVRITHPEWSKNATIYQINTRQFTAEGTFRAAEEHLPRLKELGAVILWLMPVQVIGELNRKGTLGSPYAVKDYYAVEPDLGTLDDLKHFVRT